MGALPNYAENATQEQAGRRAVHDPALISEKARKLSFAGFCIPWFANKDSNQGPAD
jgi:hypothetical protein